MLTNKPEERITLRTRWVRGELTPETRNSCIRRIIDQALLAMAKHRTVRTRKDESGISNLLQFGGGPYISTAQCAQGPATLRWKRRSYLLIAHL